MPSAIEQLALPESLSTLKFMLLLFFILHLVPMNLIVGGSVFTLISAGAKDPNSNQYKLGRLLSGYIYKAGIFVFAGIVVPAVLVLLIYWNTIPFSQLMGSTATLAAFFLFISGQIGCYHIRKKWDSPERFHSLIPGIIMLLFLLLGLLYSYNFPVMLRPETWSGYLEGSISAIPRFSDLSLYTGYLHFVISAVAISGLWVMIIGARGKSGSDDWSKWAVQYGGKMFMHATFLNLVIGIAYVISLPGEQMRYFFGANPMATHSLSTSILLTAIAIIVIFKARNSENNLKLVYTGSGMMLLVILLMTVIRQQF